MLLTILSAIISLVQEIDIPNFLLSLAILIALLSVIIQGRLCSLDNDVEWIKKEFEALDGLLADLKLLQNKLENVKSRARQFWDSEVKPEGIDLRLSKSAKKWVERAEQVASDARLFLENFDKQREVRRLIDFLPTELFRIKAVHDVVSKKNHVESAMRALLEQQDTDAKDICQTMELCRSKNRGLLNQYAHAIQEEKMSERAEDRKQLKSRGSIQEVMTTKKHLFSGMEEIRWSISLLHPLHAFLKDLSRLHLETRTEKTWMTQADNLIEEAENYVDDFWWLVSKFGSRAIHIPFAKTIFRRTMKRICSEFHRLLERRTKYNFKFIDRASGKPIRRSTSTYRNRDDVEAITLAVRDIRSKVKSGSEEVDKIIKSPCDSLEQMLVKLQGREDAAGRNACLEILKYIATEVDKNLDSYLRKPDQFMHFVQADGAITLVRRIIDASYIERQESTNVFGLENDIRRLVPKLTANGDTDSVVSIFGMEGIGKTALAEAICYNKTVVNRFQIRVWVTADQRQDSKFRAQVLEMKKERTEIPISSLRKILKEKHAFVVADNILTIKDWDELKEQLSGMTRGIRILLTTRSKDVAFHADTTGTPYQLLLRTKEESWKLFQKVISDPELEAVENRARKVVGKCGGLPLPIVSLGYLMSANGVDHEPLEWASDRINRGQNEIPWLDVEKNIYEGLDETLMNCLSHLILFPEGFEIPARRLVNLWVAEGFVKKDDSKTPEQVAEEYLQKLRDCNIIQAVDLDFYGKIKTCRLPNVLREVILKSSNKKSCRQCQSLRKQVQRRFVYNFDDRDAILGVDAMSRKRDPLSILFFDTREGNKPGERIGNILSIGITSGHFNEVKVLDLERVFKPQLPQIISKLIRLKYLGLRWTYLEEVPQLIGKLHDLETLDVKHTCIRILPSSIMRLKKLRNLYLNQRYRSRVEGKLRGNLLENLQMLWGVFIDETSPLLHGLHRLKNLRKLKLAFQLNGKQQETLAELILQLNQLHSLRLKSVDKMGKLQQLIIMNDMSNLKNLSSLQLFGKLQLRYPLEPSQLPRNLAHLTLSASNLSVESMSELQKQLTKLESLCLYADSYTWESLVCTKDSFPKLRVFRFWKLEKLKKWIIVDEAMPSLVELEIRKCRHLDFTDDWKNLKALQKIRLQGMSEEFMTKIEENRTFWDDIEIDHDNEDSL